jgi:hypothetical protein
MAEQQGLINLTATITRWLRRHRRGSSDPWVLDRSAGEWEASRSNLALSPGLARGARFRPRLGLGPVGRFLRGPYLGL